MSDIECANARRAESTIALRLERERREELERESARKLAALRAQMEASEEAARLEAAAAQAAYDEAYEKQWESGQVDPSLAGQETLAAPGVAVALDPYASGSADPTLQRAVTEPAGPLAPAEVQPYAKAPDASPVSRGLDTIELPQGIAPIQSAQSGAVPE